MERNIHDTLKKFKGSIEEEKLKLAIKQLQPNAFCNFVIESCNGLKPVSFTKADVVIRAVYEESYNREVWDTGDVGEVEQPRYTVVTFDQLFNTNLIERLGESGIRDLKDEQKPAILAILTYLRSVEFHAKALSSVRGTGTDEARRTAILTEHLFSQLSADREYVVDNRWTGQSWHQRCPCELKDCTAIVKHGCTALGSPGIWHGYVDVILNDNIAISVLPSPHTSAGEETQNLESDEDLHSEEGPPASKRACNRDQAAENDAMDTNIPDRLIAETITNAFVCTNSNSELSGWLIPTFACTGEDVSVYLYDPKHDVLLQCDSELPLWDTGYFCIDSIIKIWMFLNFTIFTFKNLGDYFEVEKSNFHCHVKRKLRSYRSLQSSHISNVSFISGEAFHKSMLCKYRRFGKKAVKKEN